MCIKRVNGGYFPTIGWLCTSLRSLRSKVERKGAVRNCRVINAFIENSGRQGLKSLHIFVLPFHFSNDFSVFEFFVSRDLNLSLVLNCQQLNSSGGNSQLKVECKLRQNCCSFLTSISICLEWYIMVSYEVI